MQFASRLDNVETSAIRELFKLLGTPGIISFAGGFPDGAMFDVEGLRAASERALAEEPGGALQYGATEGYEPLRTQLAAFMQGKGVEVAPSGLIVTTGSQQALDLLGKTMISPGDKVIVEGPTFLATIQCFRLYGAQLIGVQQMGVDVGAFWSQTQNAVDLRDVTEGIVKSLVFGVACSLIAVYEGYHSEPTPEGVGLATTRTVVSSSVMVLLLNYLLTAAFLSK